MSSGRRILSSHELVSQLLLGSVEAYGGGVGSDLERNAYVGGLETFPSPEPEYLPVRPGEGAEGGVELGVERMRAEHGRLRFGFDAAH